MLVLAAIITMACCYQDCNAQQQQQQQSIINYWNSLNDFKVVQESLITSVQFNFHHEFSLHIYIFFFHIAELEFKMEQSNYSIWKIIYLSSCEKNEEKNGLIEIV